MYIIICVHFRLADSSYLIAEQKYILFFIVNVFAEGDATELISYLWKHCPVMVWPRNPGEALPGFLTQRYRETKAQYLINLFLSGSNQTHALAPQRLLNLSLHSFPLQENKRGDFSGGPVVKPSRSSAGVWV